MKGSKFLLPFLFIYIPFVYPITQDNLEFSTYRVNISYGPFARKITLSAQQQKYSDDWKQFIQKGLLKSVNFSGHYIIVMSMNGEFQKECGSKGWVCGWIIDKTTGEIVSELPSFNGNTKYYSTIDNGTPSPDLFNMEFYPDSSMLWISGENTPSDKKSKTVKCANTSYSFSTKSFIRLFSGKCMMDIDSTKN